MFLNNFQKTFRIIRCYCTESINKNNYLSSPHTPVMAKEVVYYMKPQPNNIIIDMTFGAGGHTKRLLESVSNLKIIALDRDPVAYQYAQQLAEDYPNHVIPLLGKFSELPELLKSINIEYNSIDGILFDFGCSSMQFDKSDRGFSISKNGPLDMRMNNNTNDPTAADVLAHATEEDLYKIIKIYGDEKQAKKIARAIIDARYLFKKLTTTQELADLVNSVFPDEDGHQDKLQRFAHHATKTFQALRIFVNNELNEINYGMILAQHYLKIGGRLITITFHSLEDTIVKRHLTGNLVANSANPLPLKFTSHSFTVDHTTVKEVLEPNWFNLTKHVILPKYEEIENNPRSRSAKLRAACRVK